MDIDTIEPPPLEDSTIVITGGAGLVGQNLTVKLLERGVKALRIIDKSAHNLKIAAELHRGAQFIEADLSRPGEWQELLADADIVVCLHAQIGGIVAEDFYNNNVLASEHILSAMRPDAYMVHISSSVVESAANDHYSTSKAQQEELVVSSGQPCIVLRPTLMFGWFDRKHFGWLANFMSKTPVFPIPGHGNYTRQPLYAGDFCEIIIAAMGKRMTGQSYNISGKEKIGYYDIIRTIKATTGSRSLLLKIPYSLFYMLLAIYALFDRNPPFTTAQLQALVIDEVFEDIDWEGIFGVRATPVAQAIEETFTHPQYSKIRLQF